MIEVAFLFIFLGALIKYGKFYFLMAGYNTMSKEEKERYDVDGIASVFRNSMFGMALLIIIGWGVASWLEDPQIENYAFGISMIIGIPYLLIQSNSKRYRIEP